MNWQEEDYPNVYIDKNVFGDAFDLSVSTEDIVNFFA